MTCCGWRGLQDLANLKAASAGAREECVRMNADIMPAMKEFYQAHIPDKSDILSSSNMPCWSDIPHLIAKDALPPLIRPPPLPPPLPAAQEGAQAPRGVPLWLEGQVRGGAQGAHGESAMVRSPFIVKYSFLISQTFLPRQVFLTCQIFLPRQVFRISQTFLPGQAFLSSEIFLPLQSTFCFKHSV